jgi:hypothetical protein
MTSDIPEWNVHCCSYYDNLGIRWYDHWYQLHSNNWICAPKLHVTGDWHNKTQVKIALCLRYRISFKLWGGSSLSFRAPDPTDGFYRCCSCRSFVVFLCTLLIVPIFQFKRLSQLMSFDPKPAYKNHARWLLWLAWHHTWITRIQPWHILRRKMI